MRSIASARIRGLAAFACLAGTLCSHPATAQIGTDPIPRSQLAERCGLDPDIMAGVSRYFLKERPFTVFRNGNFCWRSD